MDTSKSRRPPMSIIRETVILPMEKNDAIVPLQQSKPIQRKPSMPSIPTDEKIRQTSDDTRPVEYPPVDALEVASQTNPMRSNISPMLAITAAQRSMRVWKHSVMQPYRNSKAAIGDGRIRSLERNGAGKNRSLSPSKAAEKAITLIDQLGTNAELDIIGNLNLSALHLTDGDMRTIIQHRPWERKKCIGIILRDNDLSAFGVYLLVDGLIAANAKIKYLSLSNNARVGDTGIEQLIRLLKANKAMTFISLSNTGLTDRGVRMLADALCNPASGTTCARLEKLHISYNKLITDKSVEALLELLEKYHSLKSLWVQNCSLSDYGRERLRRATTKAKRRFSLSE